MNYFLAANFVLLVGSIFMIRALMIRCSMDRPILVPAPRFWGHERSMYRFFPDFSFTMGALYTFLCGLLFLANCIDIWLNWGLLIMPDPPLIGKFLRDRQIFFYLLSAIGMVIAFFILPDRTMKLKDAQPAFVSFSLSWLSVALLGILLSK